MGWKITRTSLPSPVLEIRYTVHECASQPGEFSVTDEEIELVIDGLSSNEISMVFHFICVPIDEGRTVTTTLKLDDANDTERLGG